MTSTLLLLLLLAVRLLADAPLPEPVPAAPSLEPGAVAPTLQDEEAEEKGWTGSVVAGATISSGNTEKTQYSAAADGEKRVDDDRYSFGLFWNYAEEEIEGEDTTTQDHWGGKLQYDHFLTEKSYLLAQASVESDELADLDLRYTVGAGYGYQFRDDEDWKLAGEAGLAYYSEEFEDGTENDYIAARLASKATWNYSENLTFSQTAELFPSLEDSEDVYGKLDTRAEASLTDSMFARLQWVWDWDNTPAEGKERSDHLVQITLGWGF